MEKKRIMWGSKRSAKTTVTSETHEESPEKRFKAVGAHTIYSAEGYRCSSEEFTEGFDSYDEMLKFVSDCTCDNVVRLGVYQPVFRTNRVDPENYRLEGCKALSSYHDVITIHEISSKDGIIFSDGATTFGRCHASRAFSEWAKDTADRLLGKWNSDPRFTFVP